MKIRGLRTVIKGLKDFGSEGTEIIKANIEVAGYNMSLDISLEKRGFVTCDSGITFEEYTEEVFEANITHNLAGMADKAGLYEAMWCPESIGATKAGHLVKRLSEGVIRLTESPDEFKKLNPGNGWGTYENLLEVAKSYLLACRENPDAYVFAHS